MVDDFFLVMEELDDERFNAVDFLSFVFVAVFLSLALVPLVAFPVELALLCVDDTDGLAPAGRAFVTVCVIPTPVGKPGTPLDTSFAAVAAAKAAAASFSLFFLSRFLLDCSLRFLLFSAFSSSSLFFFCSSVRTVATGIVDGGIVGPPREAEGMGTFFAAAAWA